MQEQKQEAQAAVPSGPNPFCEVGRHHPRDRHRMKPLAGFPGVWECPRHDLYAQVVPAGTAEELERGDAFPTHTGAAGVVVRAGDERHGGVLLYYRPKE